MEQPAKQRILIVDDEPRMRRSLEILLGEEGYDVFTASSFYEAISKLNDCIGLVVTDLTMPGKNGIDLLKEVKRQYPETQVIMITAYSTVQSAIETMKEGAFDYLVKPFENEELLHAVKKAMHIGSLTRENIRLKQEIERMTRLGEIVGSSKKMQEIYFLVERASETDSTVLITGESGTGKELVAKAIHHNSQRKGNNFVCINCMAMTETLLESELFGYERGAFTGAIKRREGRFKIADGGTIFLDEIGEIPPSLQIKLLRVLQERTFERVGGTEPLSVDVRIIAATNRNLRKAIEDKQFREDLFYRLNVVSIEIPPLRERREDLPVLVDHFLIKKAEQLGMNKKSLSDEVKEFLMSYDYPGNVRELENIIESAYVLSMGDTIYMRDLTLVQGGRKKLPMEGGAIPVKKGMETLEEISKRLESDLLRRAAQEYGGLPNDRLAQILGTSRRILELRLKEYGINKNRHK